MIFDLLARNGWIGATLTANLRNVAGFRVVPGAWIRICAEAYFFAAGASFI
jgi:hypothetical protein